MLRYLYKTILSDISQAFDWLSHHTIVGTISTVLTAMIAQINIPYEESAFHLSALIVKDIGLFCGGFLSIATLAAYIYKKLKKK